MQFTSPKKNQETKVAIIQNAALVFLLFGSAIVFDPFFSREVYEFPKLMFFLVSVCVLTMINFWDLFIFGDISRIKKVLNKNIFELMLILLFMLGHTLAYSFSTNSSISFIGTPFRYQGFLTNIYYAILFLNALYIFIKNSRFLNAEVFKKINILLIATCLLAISPYIFPSIFPFYYFTPSFFYNRVFGTFGNPNYLASFIIALLPITALCRSKLYSGKISKFLYIPTLVLVISTLFLTGSRSSWIACIVAFSFLAILKIIKLRNFRVFMSLLIVFSIFGLGFTFKDRLAPVFPQIQRLQLDTVKSNSIGTRFILWEIAFEMIPNQPLTGYGQDMLVENIDPFLPENLKSDPMYFIDRIHNELLDIIAMHGFLTFFAYLSLFVFVWMKALLRYLKSDMYQDDYTEAVLIGILALFLYHFLNFSSITSNVIFYFMLAYLTAENNRQYSGS